MISDAAIIGSGLAGTALALALSQHSIPVRVFEARKPDASELASGVILTPNGLSVLDALGVLARIRDICWKTTANTIRNERDELVSKTEIATVARHGYCNHRVWRRVLLDEMRAMLAERGVEVRYEAGFEGVVEETSEGVVFRVGGREERAGMLVGADGIYSSVRRYLTNVVPEYTGTLGILAHIRRDQVAWPMANYEPGVTIQGKPGAIFMIPEVVDASVVMVGTQVKYPDQSKEGWEALAKDRERLKGFYRNGYEDWTATGRSVIDAVCSEEASKSLYAWPFMKMPIIEHWASEKTSRVVLVGDAVHALPPSSGQGVNQALEDVYALTLLLLKSRKGLRETLDFWQQMRQERVSGILDFATNTTNVQRMSEAERQQLVAEGKFNEKSGGSKIDRDWIYQTGIKERVETWVCRL